MALASRSPPTGEIARQSKLRSRPFVDHLAATLRPGSCLAGIAIAKVPRGLVASWLEAEAIGFISLLFNSCSHFAPGLSPFRHRFVAGHCTKTCPKQDKPLDHRRSRRFFDADVGRNVGIIGLGRDGDRRISQPLDARRRPGGAEFEDRGDHQQTAGSPCNRTVRRMAS